MYDARTVAKMRSEVWEIGFYFTIVWLSVVGLIALLTTLCYALDAHSDLSGLATFVVAAGAPGLALLALRIWRQRALDPNRDAATRRARLHDPMHPGDVTSMLKSIRHKAPEEIDRAVGLFSALSAAGGWSVDAPLAESLRRRLSDRRIPPSLLAGLRSLKTYGETPAIDNGLASRRFARGTRNKSVADQGRIHLAPKVAKLGLQNSLTHMVSL
jgi:hypothetical protein